MGSRGGRGTIKLDLVGFRSLIKQVQITFLMPQNAGPSALTVPTVIRAVNIFRLSNHKKVIHGSQIPFWTDWRDKLLGLGMATWQGGLGNMCTMRAPSQEKPCSPSRLFDGISLDFQRHPVMDAHAT